jgi:hypothetical protein
VYKLILKRFAYTPMGTFGSMQMPDGTKIFTVEDAWRENKPNVSCIPLGSYHCSPRFYNRGGYPAIRIEDVENRSHILIHRGNTELDVEGCIVTGMKLGFINNRWAVASSRAAFDIVVENLGDQHFELLIENFDPSQDSYLSAGDASMAASQAAIPASLLQKHGVVTQSLANEDFEYVDSIKGKDQQDSINSSSSELNSFKQTLRDFDVSWYEELGYIKQADDNSYKFFSTDLDVQRGANDEPMCSLMPMGDTGFLNMATVLSPSAKQLEKLRKKLERTQSDDERSLILSELGLTVKRAALLLNDRSGAKTTLAEVSPSGTSPHSAMFVTQLSAQDFPLVNAALAGELDLMTVEYDVEFYFPKVLHASLNANVAELKSHLQERNLWLDGWNAELAKALFEELIDAEQIELSLPTSGASDLERQRLKDYLLSQLADWLQQQAQSYDDESDDSEQSSNSELISLERTLEVSDTVALTMTTDAADWKVGGVEFD